MFCSVLFHSEWLIHPLPRYLVLTGAELVNSFFGGKGADVDIVDGIIRRFRQLDSTVKSLGLPARWRHFFETDFAVFFPVFWSPYFPFALCILHFYAVPII